MTRSERQQLQGGIDVQTTPNAFPPRLCARSQRSCSIDRRLMRRGCPTQPDSSRECCSGSSPLSTHPSHSTSSPPPHPPLPYRLRLNPSASAHFPCLLPRHGRSSRQDAGHRRPHQPLLRCQSLIHTLRATSGHRTVGMPTPDWLLSSSSLCCLPPPLPFIFVERAGPRQVQQSHSMSERDARRRPASIHHLPARQ